MEHSPEVLRGGGGSIRLGTTGSISELMKRELESRVSTPQRPVSSRSRLQTEPVSVPCGSMKRIPPRKSLDEVSSNRIFSANTSKMQPRRKSLDEGGISRIRNSLPPRKSLDEASCRRKNPNLRGNAVSQKAKSLRREAHRIPMLNSENAVLERAPSREKSYSRRSQLAEIVDIKCGYSDSSTRIANRLKKLGFSKLSQSII